MTAEKSNCWPTTGQLLLLTAALSEPDQAVPAWQTYCRLYDLKKVDYVDITFFAMVFRNIGNSSPEMAQSVEMTLCKSHYRHQWMNNQWRLRHTVKTLALLQNNGIDVCLLKGAAMVAVYYQDPGVRVFGDVDVLLPKSLLLKAVALLASQGWHTVALVKPEVIMKGMHEITMRGPAGESLDLHWAIFSEGVYDPRLSATPLRYQKAMLPAGQFEMRALCAEDMLIHVLYHGLKYSATPLIRWIADACTILKKEPFFDWIYFFTQVEKLGVVYSVQKGLLYLVEKKLILISGEIEAKLKLLKPAKMEKERFKIFSLETNNIRDRLIFSWHLHRYYSRFNTLLLLIASYPAFLKKYILIEHWYQMPFFCIKKTIKLLLGQCKRFAF